MDKVGKVSWKRFEKFLLAIGCEFKGQEGSHRKYKKLDYSAQSSFRAMTSYRSSSFRTIYVRSAFLKSSSQKLSKIYKSRYSTDTGNTVVTPGTSTDRHQNQYCTDAHVQLESQQKPRKWFLRFQHIQRIPSSIPFLVLAGVSCRNHTEIDPILSRGAGIELAKLSVCTSY